MPQHVEVQNYPKKLYYKINEVAKIADLKPHVLRYWETEFKELAPRKDENDQRRYRPRDIELVLAIKHLLYDEGFTIKGARQQLKHRMNRRAPEVIDVKPSPAVRRAEVGATIQDLASKVQAVRKELSDLCAFLEC